MMKTWILAAALFLTALTLPALCAAPDFSWGTDCAQLSTAKEKWQAAAVVLPPKGSQSPQPQPFDTAYVHKMLAQDSFNDSPYAMLDDAMRRARILEESRKTYSQALEQCKPANSDELSKSFNAACSELKYSISLVTALARAGIARKMADNESSAYCFQAMESAIDTLTAAQKEETDRERKESLTRLRGRLFSVWEQAQRSRDLSLIRDFDLLGAFDESIVLSSKQAGTH